MLYWLVDLSDQFQLLNAFRYISFRTGGATMTALLSVFLLGPALIKALRTERGGGLPIRDDGPACNIREKQGTPIIGGLVVLMGVCLATLLWGNLGNAYVWIVLALMLGYGAVGLCDDHLKVTRQSTQGFPAKVRFGLEAAIAAIAVYVIVKLGQGPFSTSLAIPFFENMLLDLGFMFILLGVVVIVGAGNAVNLTDGVGGLAIVSVMIAAATFGILSYLVGNTVFSDYLQIHFVAGTGELAVICGALVGAGIGLLWLNAPPATIFIGDTGSLVLGGALGTIAVANKHELVLAIVGGLLVLETRLSRSSAG